MADEDDPTGYTPATFHEQAGVADWRVTSWGAQAVFTAASFSQSSRLISAIVAAAEHSGIQPDVDLRPEAAIVLVPYRGASRIPAGAVAFAREVSAAAAALDLVAEPQRAQTVDIMVAQRDVDARPFWAAALGYDLLGDTDAVDPLRRGPSLSFMQIDRSGRGRTHVDVSVPADQAVDRVTAALAAGGRLVDDAGAPMWWTIASPDNHGIDIAAWTDTWKG